jgi:quercetin dioxygenase-like cupin family protein
MSKELRMKLQPRRGMRLALMTVGFVGLLVAVTAIPGTATPPDRFSSQLLGRGTYVDQGTLPLGQGLDIVVVKVTVAPGGASGWHSHPGGAIAIIQQGEMTTYESVGNHCVITTYTKGQSFIERPGHVLIAVNTGSTDTTVIATFPGVPVGGSPRIDADNPGTCPGV